MTATRNPAPAGAQAAPVANGWQLRTQAQAFAGDLAANEAEILLYGDIGASFWDDEESISARELIDQLDALPETIDQLTVRINSYGGSVADGTAIYNALRRHRAAINVMVDGVAVSIASLIAMAGDTVQMAGNALMMIHGPHALAHGNATQLRKAADVLDTHGAAMADSYARKSGQSTEAVMALLTDGEDHWYTAAEAQAAGFCDEITDALQDVAASLPPADRFSVPAAKADHPKTRTSKMTNKTDPKNSDPVAGGQGSGAPAQGTEPAAAGAGDSGNQPTAAGHDAVRARNESIRAVFRPFAHQPEIRDLETEALADPGITVEQARAQLLDKLGEGSEPMNPQAHAPRVEPGMSDAEKAHAGMRDALLSRVGVAEARAQTGNEFRGMRLHEMARASLERTGYSTRGMSPMEIAQAALRVTPPRGAQTTSDFPVILEDAMHKMVISGYSAQPDTWSRFCRTGDVSDFRDHKRLATGVIGNLEEVNEAGEYQNGNIPDGEAQSVAAKRRGKIIQVTPEMLVNDDLGEIMRMANNVGRAGSRTIESAVYAVLNSNPKLSDNKALFHSDHGNLASSGGKPSVDTLDAARQAMRKQKDPSGNEYLDLMPSVAVVPVQEAGNTRVVVEAIYDPDSTNALQKPNMVNGIVGDIVDSARLSGNAWYLFADPAVAPVIEVAFLDGQREPTIAQEENFRTAGLSWRIELPFGVAPVDYRGGYKNPGA